MKGPYQLSYENNGSINLYDIPDGDESFLASIDEVVIQTEEAFRLCGAIIMNHKAYAMMCSALSRKQKLKKIKSFSEYNGIPVFVVAIPGHDNNKYQPYILGAPAIPDERDFFRSLNQEQFHTGSAK